MKNVTLNLLQTLKASCSLFLIIALLLSCDDKTRRQGHYNILPFPQQFKITGISDFDCSNVQTYFNDTKAVLPVFDDQLDNLIETGNVGNADIVLKIDTALNLKSEGYVLSIDDEKITIKGKDKAGLFYGLMSLSQLMEDSC